VYKPVGGWKKEPNSTVGVIDGTQVIFEYALPAEVPGLMADWFKLFDALNRAIRPGDRQQALNAYVHLHIAIDLVDEVRSRQQARKKKTQ
jgi:hypothetical protein